MTLKVELAPVSEGNRITLQTGDTTIVGRGSSLGCNDKKISRNHAELMFKDDDTLWIKPVHTNPVFYRPIGGKTLQLTKDVERQLNDGDQIGLLPSSFFFRVNFLTNTDKNNNNDDDSDMDSPYAWKKDEELPSPSSPLDRSPPSATNGNRFSTASKNNSKDTSVFDFDEDVSVEPTPSPSKRTSFSKKTPDVEPKRKASPDVEPKRKTSPDVEPKIKTIPDVEPKRKVSLKIHRVAAPVTDDSNDNQSDDTNEKPRKLPKWMQATTTTTTPTTTTPTSSYSRNSSYTASTSAKRHLSFDGNNDGEQNESSNMSDAKSPAPSTPVVKPATKPTVTKSFDSDDDEDFDAISPKKPSATSQKGKANGKRRGACSFGATCYRKNPAHRIELSHPGDSDYDDAKQADDDKNNEDDDDDDKPACPFGKTCYRQNPQHKRDFKH